MDELVAVGTAGLLGLILAALFLFGGIIWILGMLWNAYLTGDWQRIGQVAGVLFIVALWYTGAGVWLQKTGRI